MNLVPNPSFEDQKSCVPWGNFGGTVADGTPARSGTNACAACSPPTDAINFVTALDGNIFAAGEMVHVELWVRAADPTLVAFSANLYVETKTINPGEPVSIRLTQEYQRLSYDYAMPLEGGAAQTPQISLLVPRGADAGGIGCVLIDDISACRVDPK